MKLLRKTISSFFVAVFLFVALCLSTSISFANEIQAAQKYIQTGGYALAKNGKILYSANKKTAFIPASTIKLITTLAALTILEPEFAFQTKLYLDNQQNLIIQGFGDPFLVSEKVDHIVKLVAKSGITEINNIILDDSSFRLESPTEGSSGSTNPYDANCSALAVNFNTLPIHIDQQSKVQSPEAQTPFIPLMGIIGKDLTKGYHRVNIDAFPKRDELSNSLRYCGELFHAFLEKHGIKIQGVIRHGRVPESSQLLLDFKAEESIADLSKSCLRSSNNFMANQLYLALGVHRFGYPATWHKSHIVMKDFITKELQLNEKQITMVEGSGISVNNRITPEALITVLEHFRPYASLIPIKNGTRMKSGTLVQTGVFCYAGYIPDGKDNRSFVILLNQKQNHRDTILKLLHRN